jgi:transcriptional regulator with XRE-family HTH domain
MQEPEGMAMTGLVKRLRERMRVRGHWKPGTDQPNVKAAADATGIGYATLYDIVHGKTREPKHETLEALAREYGVTVEWLLHGPRGPDGETFEQGAEFAMDLIRQAIAEIERELEERRSRREPRPSGVQRLDSGMTKRKHAG